MPIKNSNQSNKQKDIPNSNEESLTIGDNDYIYICSTFLFPIIR